MTNPLHGAKAHAMKNLLAFCAGRADPKAPPEDMRTVVQHAGASLLDLPSTERDEVLMFAVSMLSNGRLHA